MSLLRIFCFLLATTTTITSKWASASDHQQQSTPPLPVIFANTSLGVFQGGIRKSSVTGYRYKSWLKIPYAEEPKRFQLSSQKLPFSHVYDATNYGDKCPLPERNPPIRLEQNSGENCLFMKFMTPPDASPTKTYPVIFWPNGGGFFRGSNQDYSLDAQADNFISRGIVIAQPTYRGGIFGFWSTFNGPEAPLNLGLRDVYQALQFTKQHARAFGGDPNRITLYGQDAGGTVSSLLGMMPFTQGLYSGTALLSSSAFIPYVSKTKQQTFGTYAATATAAKCVGPSGLNAQTAASVANCMKNRTVLELLKAQHATGMDNPWKWHPVLQDRQIFPGTLDQLATKRPVLPTLMGTMNNEALFDMIVRPTALQKTLPNHANFTLRLPPNFNSYLNTRQNVLDSCTWALSQGNFLNPAGVIDVCQRYYTNLPKVPDPFYWLLQASDLISTYHFHAPTIKDLNHQLANGNQQVYLYSFDYVRNSAQDHDFWASVRSFHNFDLCFVEDFFPYAGAYKFIPNSDDMFIQSKWLDVLAAFAATYNPTISGQPTWQPLYNKNGVFGSNHYSVNVPFSMQPAFHTDSVNFWNHVIPLYANSTPSAPTTTAPYVRPTPTKADVCQVTVKNNGWYILKIDYVASNNLVQSFETRNEFRGQSFTFTSEAFYYVYLRARTGRQTRCPIFTPLCTQNGGGMNIVCSGTTYFGFKCQIQTPGGDQKALDCSKL